MKQLLFFLCAALLIITGCSQEKRITLVLEWQPPTSEVCRACQQCGVKDEEIHRAYITLKEKLAAEGFDVKLVEKQPSDKPSNSFIGMKVCDVPLEVWLDARTEAVPCQGAAAKGDADEMRRTLKVGIQGYQVVPADMMIQAGLMAAEHIRENGGKIDVEKISSPKGCGGCPSRGKCGAEK